MEPKFTVLLFYKYIQIDDPAGLLKLQKELCESLKLKGRMIIACEGINGTFEGETSDIEKYIDFTRKDGRFEDIHFKISEGKGSAFPKLSIKVRSEIVSGHLGDADVKPYEVTGKYISPEELREWIKSGKEFYIVDMRNDYEQEVGLFKGSIKSGMRNFRDLPQVLPKISDLKNKTVLTVCTGGVRCEKASGFLIKNGFGDVYQLYGGIVNYMEKYPNEDFEGALYVFDRRIVMGFNMNDSNHLVIGRCAKCKKPSENYINCKIPECNRHFIACKDCAMDGIFCPAGCLVGNKGQVVTTV